MVVFGQYGCTLARLVVFGQEWFFFGKLVVFEQKWLYSYFIPANVVVIRAKVVIFAKG